MSGTCFECKFMRQRTELEPCEHCTNVFAMTGTHPNFEPRKPLTNYDRLISKTPEEMAHWLVERVIDSPWCKPDAPVDPVTKQCEIWDCERCALEWLKQEAEEGE